MRLLIQLYKLAGRANRYQEKPDQGEVYLYEIEEICKAINMIYGTDLILKTKNVLKSITELEETQVVLFFN